MFIPPISEHELNYRQQQVHTDFVASQRQMSLNGLRQLLGNSVIELGSRIHGMTSGSCQEAAETSDHIRTILRTRKAQPATSH